MKKLRFSSNQCAIKIKLKFSKSREREVWETRTEQDTSGHTCVKAITLLLWGNCPRRRPRSRSQRNWGQLLLKVSGLIKNAFGQEEEEEAEENVTWLVFFDFYCIPLPRPPALFAACKCPANCSNYMNNRQDCSMSAPPSLPPHLCIWQVLQSILLYNDRSVCCPIMTHGLHGWMRGEGRGLMIFALSAQFVAFLRHLASTT